MVEPALVQLNRIITQPSTSDSDRLRAIQMTLDRTGYVTGHRIEVEVKPWEQTMQRIVKELPPELEAADSRVVDAELVEEDSESQPTLTVEPLATVTQLPTRVGSAEPPRRS